MRFIEWSQLLHRITLVAHALQDWQPSIIFRTASPNIRKFKPFDRCQHHGKCECLVFFVCTIYSHSKQGLLTCASPKPILVYGIVDTWRTYEKWCGVLGRLTNSLAGTQRGNGDIYNRSFSFAKRITGRLSRLLWLGKLNSTLAFVFLLYIFNYCELELDCQQPNEEWDEKIFKGKPPFQVAYIRYLFDICPLARLPGYPSGLVHFHAFQIMSSIQNTSTAAMNM
jgi:hypothetical protein